MEWSGGDDDVGLLAMTNIKTDYTIISSKLLNLTRKIRKWIGWVAEMIALLGQSAAVTKLPFVKYDISKS